jgi:phospholipid/cholesterol/gamma-HCH transport system substrate-binding protein
MNKKSIEVMVGLFVLLGIAALLFLALKAANLASFGQHEGYVVRARFDNIGGLKPRAPVRSAGVTVGRVRSISLDPKTYQGVVRLEIDNHVKFPTDTSAKILTAGLLGDQYIGLEPGYAEKEIVASDTISQTQSAVVLENLIGQLIFNRAADAGTDAPAPPAPSASAVKKQP